jgi:putative restriction endonuclease
MNYWWVNQNQTYKEELTGGFLWSPKTTKDGKRNQFYDNMELVRRGDLILSFSDARIQAVGIAQGAAQTAAKPDFGSKGDYWLNEGWLVSVEFIELKEKPRPKDIIDEIRPLLPKKYSPLQQSGDGNQGVYLAAIDASLAKLLLSKSDFVPALIKVPDEDEQKADAEQKTVEGRTDIGVTQKQQLVQSRRGQGVFRANVRLNENRCRVTGVNNSDFLIASHIKPWSESTDKEKLDGNNGLLLAPHVDQLFDKGWISFSNEGDLLLSPKLDRDILQCWAIAPVLNVGRFSADQCYYLEYHRKNKFRK